MSTRSFAAFEEEDERPRENLLVHIKARSTISREELCEVYAYPADSILSLRRSISAAIGLPHIVLQRDGTDGVPGAAFPDHLTLSEAGLQNHSEVLCEGVEEVFVLSGSADCTVKLWEANRAECMQSVTAHDDQVLSVAVSPDGSHTATASADFTAKVWNAETGKCEHSLKDRPKTPNVPHMSHRDWVNSVAFSPCGRKVVTASMDCSAKLWDIETGKCLWCTPGAVHPLFSVLFSGAGRSMVAASADRTARVWDVASGKVVLVLDGSDRGEGHQDNVHAAAFSPRGTEIVTGSVDCSVKIWDFSTGRCLRTMTEHSDAVQTATFSPDGKLVLSSSLDRTAKIWKADTGERLRTLEGHNGAVLSAAFMPDGHSVATASRDCRVRVWDAKTGRMLALMQGHRDKATAVCFMPF